MGMLQGLFTMLGIKPDAGQIIGAIASSIAKIGDRKARMAAVEVAALTAAQYNQACLVVLTADASETATKVKDALLLANMQTFGLLAKTVDLDGSLDDPNTKEGK